MVFDGRLAPTWATPQELQGCAVAVLKAHPLEQDTEILLERVREMLSRRKLLYRLSYDLEAALRSAARFEATDGHHARCQG